MRAESTTRVGGMLKKSLNSRFRQRVIRAGPVDRSSVRPHSGHPSSNSRGLSMNATVRVRIALLDKVLDHSSKMGGGLVAMVQLVG